MAVARIVVVGSESTGSTTLAADLAAALGVVWVPEHLRAYAEEKAAAAGSIWAVEWTSADFDAVADGQEALERAALADAEAKGHPYLVCDNDVFAVAVWHRRYLGRPSPALAARAEPPLLYVLTLPDGVPFVQDGLRDGEHIRVPMTGWFRSALVEQSAPWMEVGGDPRARVEAVLDRLGHSRSATSLNASSVSPTSSDPSAQSSPADQAHSPSSDSPLDTSDA